MELKIKSFANEPSAFTHISFTPECIILHGLLDKKLPYEQTELTVIIHLTLSTAAGGGFFVQQSPSPTKGHSSLIYQPNIGHYTFKFNTNGQLLEVQTLTPIQIEHTNFLKQIFTLLDEKHPFKKFTYEITNTTDFPRQEFAKELTRQLEEHIKYGMHTEKFEMLSQLFNPGTNTAVYTKYPVFFRAPEYAFPILVGVVFPAIGILFSIGIMAYLLPQWDNNGIYWGFAIGTSLLTLFCIWFMIKQFKIAQINKKLNKLKQAEKNNP